MLSCAPHCCFASRPLLHCTALHCIAHQLVDEAYTRWAEEEEGVVDDITAVVVKLIHGQQ